MSHHGIAVGPSEVPLEHLVVEAEPLVVAAQTCEGAKRETGQLKLRRGPGCLGSAPAANCSTPVAPAAAAAAAAENPHLKSFLICLPLTAGLDREPGTQPNNPVSLNPAGL